MHYNVNVPTELACMESFRISLLSMPLGGLPAEWLITFYGTGWLHLLVLYGIQLRVF